VARLYVQTLCCGNQAIYKRVLALDSDVNCITGRGIEGQPRVLAPSLILASRDRPADLAAAHKT